jgi:hypothetical protein
MPTGAKVDSIDALINFRVALVKFREAAAAALGDAESEIHRVVSWVENDQDAFWTNQIRLRDDALRAAHEALRHKTIFKDSTGREPSAIEEKKAVARAQHRLEEARHKQEAVRRWGKYLNREVLLYRGQVQRFVTSVSHDVPAAIAHLGALINKLQEYEALTPGQAASLDPAAAAFFTESGMASMARGDSMPMADAPLYAHLRSRAPKPGVRSAAPERETPLTPWVVPPLSELAEPAIAALHVNWSGPNPTDKVILASGVETSARIFLDRASSDGGWYIGPIEPSEASVGLNIESVTVAELLSARPDWRQLLNLPAGYLAVIDRGGIVAILNDRDENIWTPHTLTPQTLASGQVMP